MTDKGFKVYGYRWVVLGVFVPADSKSAADTISRLEADFHYQPANSFAETGMAV